MTDNSTHHNSLRNKRNTKQLSFLAILFLFITVIAAWWGLEKIKIATLASTENTLTTVLNTTKEALDIWVNDQISKAQFIANKTELTTLTQQLIKAQKRNLKKAKSDIIQRLTAYIQDHQESEMDYHIILPNGMIIAANNPIDIGNDHVIYRYRNAIFKEILNGVPRFIPPVPSDRPLKGKNNIAEKNVPATLFSAAPIKDSKKNVIAIFAKRSDPKQTLSRITALGRIGTSGETYAFDNNARLLTASRFDHMMIKRGFMLDSEQSILAFEIKDPGGKLIDNIPISTQHTHRPLTLMAQKATSGIAGQNIKGYHDYRGEVVLGSWVWMPHLDIGLTTEIDKLEALSIYETTRLIIAIILLILVSMAIIFIYFVFLANKQVEDNLKQSHDELEEKVKERTQELLDSEASLIVAKDQAEQASRTKSDFLASMSHEIRTPINGVMGMLGLLIKTAESDEQERKLNIALSSSKSLLNIINDILDFSKVEVGKIELESIDFNLETLLNDIVNSMAFSAEEHDLELIMDATQLSNKMLIGDPNRLRQVITNLIGNAIKFTHSGSVIVRCATTPYRESILLTCRIIDTGIGIPEDRIHKLFDSFTQADTSTTREYGGTGLGLTISKKLVSLMQGDIDIKSKVDVGSEFSFTAVLEKSNKAETYLPDIDLSSKNILIVDDNPVNREIFIGQLSNWGANTFEAESGANALKLCEDASEQPIHIIILDMQMPAMDGIQFIKILRRNKQYNGIKVLMMTSVLHDQTPEELSALGLNGWFTKPVNPKDLHHALLTVCSNEHDHEQAFVTTESLQIVKTKPKDKAKDIAKDTSNQNWPNHTRILMVEDNDINQLVTEGILETIGLGCDIARHGEECLSMLNASSHDNPYTAVLMDCQMPVMDGYQATENIRRGLAGERYRQIPIIAMTANAMKGDREKCLLSGMNDYLSKPIETELLQQTLVKWLITTRQ